jgi:hypothetical protein
MADIRCPMCGKPNPAGSDTCQYCQARLTPLIINPPSEPQKPPSEPQKPPSEPPASRTGDWLSDLRSEQPAESSFEESDATGGSSDFGDWFSRLEETTPAAAETPAKKPLQPEAEAFPEWLSESKETPAPAAGKEEGLDWLQEFHAQAAEEAVPSPGEPHEDSGIVGATAWLSGLAGLATPVEEAGQAEPAGFAEPTGFAEPAQELPDWMKPAPEPGAVQQPAASQEPVPDWMREVGGEAAAGELYGIEGAKTAKPEETTEPAGFAEPAGFVESTEPAAEKGEMPEWLKSQMPPSISEESPSIFPETSGKSDIGWPAEQTPSAPQAGVPDWLSEATTQAAGDLTSAEQMPSAPATEEGSTNWFSKLGITSEEKPSGALPAFVMSDDEMAPFVSGDEMAATGPGSGGLESLPDWLSQVPTEQPAETPPASAAQLPTIEPQADAGLAPAQLPTWLEAMRPVESAAPSTPYEDEVSSSIETAGPLAGLRGVLPAEAEIARIRKPPVYSNKLQVSEAHQARVSLLEELVAAEGQPKPVASHMVIVSQTGLRLAIALVLIAAVFGALWMGNKWTSLPDPQSAPQELEDLRGQIEALTTSAPVLVAFDYEPGFSGEMEAASAAVIAHLVEKQVPLLLVSTNPLGPALAERQMKKQVDELNSQLLANTSPYTTSLFTNLGYIPGGIDHWRNTGRHYPGPGDYR